MEEISIGKLAESTRDEQQRLGLTVQTVWTGYCDSLLPIVKFHHQRGTKYFDHEIVSDYISSIEGRRDRGEIGHGYYIRLKRGAERLIEMHDTGRLEWSCPVRVSKFKLNEYFDNILNEYLESTIWHPNTRGDIVWVVKKFFSWLILEGYETLDGIDADVLQRFMIYCSNHMRRTSLHDVKLYMKKLCRYLNEAGRLPSSFEELLSFRISRESRQFPAASPDEVAAILSVIDRRTPKGKRDYAMVLLGVATGLRAADIVGLRLAYIDWKNGEIRTVQSKTGKTVVLPLTRDVGEAIRDYILDGRPDADSTSVFLRFRAPFRAFADGMAVAYLYNDYCKKANILREPFDGKGFHSLRRALGTSLVTSGIPITTVAQILGDANVESTKKYVALDCAHLKEVALDFTGIGMEVVSQ